MADDSPTRPGPGSLPPAEGRLLVATRVIGDPSFEDTVIGLLEHDDAVGSLGIVLNRPSVTTLDEVLTDWAALACEPPVLFSGGPVAQNSALGLALIAEGVTGSNWTAIFDRLAIVDLANPPDRATPDGVAMERVRLYSGYAGWGAGQLASELAAGAWWVFDSVTADWFAPDTDLLRGDVLRRHGGKWRMWANAPEDLRAN